MFNSAGSTHAGINGGASRPTDTNEFETTMSAAGGRQWALQWRADGTLQ